MTSKRQRQIAQAIVMGVFDTLDDLVASDYVRGTAYDRLTKAVLDAMEYQKVEFSKKKRA